MIDSHCHLEQKDYDKDRDDVIEKCKKELKVVITCCADPRDWKLTKEIAEKHKGFVFPIAGIHPEFIKDIAKKEIDDFVEVIKKEAKAGNIVGIGEIGLDYFWIKEAVWRDKQKDLFLRFIDIAKKLDFPLIVHSRDAFLECVVTLEQKRMQGRKVLMHLFGDKKLIPRIVKNGWLVSIGPGILKSKTMKKIARDIPLNNLLLETDSPWFGMGERGLPTNVKKAAEKVAEIKKIPIKEVEKQTDLNAIKFFRLKLNRH